MASMSAASARNSFATVLNRAASGKERVIVERRGKAIAAVVSMDDVALLQWLEDQRDVADARAARKEARRKGTISAAKLRAGLMPEPIANVS